MFIPLVSLNITFFCLTDFSSVYAVCRIQDGFFHSLMCSHCTYFLCLATSPSSVWPCFVQLSSVRQHLSHNLMLKLPHSSRWSFLFWHPWSHRTYMKCSICKWGHSTSGSLRKVCARVTEETLGPFNLLCSYEKSAKRRAPCRRTDIQAPPVNCSSCTLASWAMLRIRPRSASCRRMLSYPLRCHSWACLHSIQRGEEALTIKSRFILY